MKKRRNFFGIFLGIIIILIFSTIVLRNSVFSYDTTVAHPNIVDLATKVFNENSNQKLTSQQIAWMREGAEAEDMPIRWMNHFYDPVYNVGFKSVYLTAKDWSWDSDKQRDYVFGDKSWQRSIIDYQNGDNEEAFKALGHVLHLIADMSVPAHTRDDAHPFGDSLEQFIKYNWDLLYQGMQNLEMNLIYYPELNNYFDNLAKYSNNNFYSDDTIESNKYNIIEVVDSFSKNETKLKYNLAELNGSQYYLFLSDNAWSWQEGKNNIKTLNDQYILTDYTKHLLPKAVGYSAGVIKLFFEEVEKKQDFNLNKDKVSLTGKLSYMAGYVVKKVGELFDNKKDIVKADENTVMSIMKGEAISDAEAQLNLTNIDNQTIQLPNNNTYFLQFLNSGQTLQILSGQEIKLNVKVKNIGTALWKRENISINVVGGVEVNLLYHHFSWLTHLRPALLNEPTISAGGEGSFTFIINAPEQSGNYIFKIQAVQIDNGFVQIPFGFWTLNLTVSEEQNMTQEQEKIKSVKKQLRIEEKVKNFIDNIEEKTPEIADDIKKIAQQVFFGYSNSSNPEQENEDLEPEEFTPTSTEFLFLPTIQISFPTTSPFITKATSTIIQGAYNTSTFSILINNTQTPDLVMASGMWQYFVSLPIGASTFVFQGWDEDLTTSSSVVSVEIISQPEEEIIETIILSAPAVLFPTTNSIYYTSSTSVLVSGEKEENVDNVFVINSGVIVSSTILTTTTWEVVVDLSITKENTLLFYGEDDLGNISPTSSLIVIVDQISPVMTYLLVNVSSTDVNIKFEVNTEFSATDNLTTISLFEVQFILPEFYDVHPQTVCNDENSVFFGADDPVLDIQSLLLSKPMLNSCAWFTTTTSTNILNFNFLPDLFEWQVIFKARAYDQAGNMSDWYYADEVFLLENRNIVTNMIISEIAWMGTIASPDDEWIQIFNNSGDKVNLLGWSLVWGAFNPQTRKYENRISLQGWLLSGWDTMLLERTDQTTVSDYDGSIVYNDDFELRDSGEHLLLLDAFGNIQDEVNCLGGRWFAGNSTTTESMFRRPLLRDGNDPNSWIDFLATMELYPYYYYYYTPRHDADGNWILGSPGQ